MNHDELGMAVEAYRLMVFRIAYGYAKNTDDAEDITQEVFLKLFKSSSTFTCEEHKKAWLIRVTVNVSKNLLKSAWHKKRFDFSENQNYLIRDKDDELFLSECVRRLKPKYQTVIYLFYYEDYAVKEIAAILKISESAVKTRLTRAREQLKKTLINEGDFYNGQHKKLYQKNV